MNDFEKDDIKEINKQPEDEVVVNKLSLKEQFRTSRGRVRFITRVAMFTALAYVFYSFLKFPLPFFPSFLEVKFHNLFILLGSFLTGPVGGTITILASIGLKMLTLGSSTQFVGELTDIGLSMAIMLTGSLIYFFKHDKAGGIIGIIISFGVWILVSFFLNMWVSFPFYLQLYFKGNIDGFVAMLNKWNSNITADNILTIYLFAGVLPFNALVGGVNCALLILTYKRISSLLKQIGM